MVRLVGGADVGRPWRRSRCCARRSAASVGVLLAWVVPVVWAAVVDARVSRLPDRVVVVGAVVFGAALVVLAVIEGRGRRPLGALVGAAVLGVPFAVLHLASPAGFGLGDVKYGVLVGARARGGASGAGGGGVRDGCAGAVGGGVVSAVAGATGAGG